MKSEGTLRSLTFALENEFKNDNKKSKGIVVIEENGIVSIQAFENGVLQECPHHVVAVAKDVLSIVEQIAESTLRQRSVAN